MTDRKKKKPPAKMGRSSLLNIKRQTEIVTALQAGATLEIAANYAGVTYNTLHNWRERGRAEFERIEALELLGDDAEKPPAADYKPSRNEKKYFLFFKAINEATAVAAVGWLQVIDTVAAQSPEWAAWQLARRYPKEFGSQRAVPAVSVQTGETPPGEEPTGNTGTEVVIRIQYVDHIDTPSRVEDSPYPPNE